MSKKLTLVGGKKRPQVQGTSRRSWTPGKEKEFLSSLAENSNVKLSAKRAGVSAGYVYRRRNSVASFRASWDAALASGYAQLEMMLLERALHGVEKTVVRRDGTTTIMREYSDKMALSLLRMHRENATFAHESVDDGEWQEARDRICSTSRCRSKCP